MKAVAIACLLISMHIVASSSSYIMINFNHLSYNFLLVDVHAELGARLLSGEEEVLEDPPHGFVSPDHGAAHQEVGAGQPPHVLHTLTVSPTDNWCSWSNTILNILNICPHSQCCCCCERKVVFCIPLWMSKWWSAPRRCCCCCDSTTAPLLGTSTDWHSHSTPHFGHSVADRRCPCQHPKWLYQHILCSKAWVEKRISTPAV